MRRIPPKTAVDRATERRRIEASFKVFGVPQWAREAILEALESGEWDWYRDCDGCTTVSEAYWPTKYFPPCVLHDFEWFTGRGGWQSNIRFYRLQRIYRITRGRSALRWAGVTLGWYGYFKWKHMLKGNVKKETER